LPLRYCYEHAGLYPWQGNHPGGSRWPGAGRPAGEGVAIEVMTSGSRAWMLRKTRSRSDCRRRVCPVARHSETRTFKTMCASLQVMRGEP